MSRALNSVFSSHDETMKIFPGLELVQNDNVNQVQNKVNDERSMPDQGETVVTRLGKFLQTHDLKIKFSDLVGKSDLQEIVSSVFNNDEASTSAAPGEGEKSFFVTSSEMLRCGEMKKFLLERRKFESRLLSHF